MAATAAQIAQLRRMVAEPSSATYTDETLAAYIEACPLIDGLGRDPVRISPTNPPELEANPYWAATYDLNRAAAAIWDEKAAALATKFDFVTDNQTFTRSQLHTQAMKQAAHYRARQSARTVKLWPHPQIGTRSLLSSNVSPYYLEFPSGL